MTNKTVAIKGRNIDIVRLSVLIKALALECRGMSRRGRSAYSILKSEYGIKGGSKQVVLERAQLVLERCLEIAEVA